MAVFIFVVDSKSFSTEFGLKRGMFKVVATIDSSVFNEIKIEEIVVKDCEGVMEFKLFETDNDVSSSSFCLDLLNINLEVVGKLK